MDTHRFIRMSIGGVVCLVIGAVSFVAVFYLLSGIAEGAARIPTWLRVSALGILALETFVLTVAGLILVIWALVAAIAGPPASIAQPDMAKERRKPANSAVAPSDRRGSRPVTPTALIDPSTGVSRLDPEKRRPTQF